MQVVQHHLYYSHRQFKAMTRHCLTDVRVYQKRELREFKMSSKYQYLLKIDGNTKTNINTVALSTTYFSFMERVTSELFCYVAPPLL